MKRRLTTLALSALMVTLISLGLMLPSPVFATGSTQISGVGFFPTTGECTDTAGQEADYALKLTGDLEGCLYGFIETAECSPSGTYLETGTETFVGQYNGEAGTFRTTYRFTAKFEDCTNLAGEIFGRCQHPIIAGSGEGVFEGASGRVDIKDDVEAENFPYKGHLKW